MSLEEQILSYATAISASQSTTAPITDQGSTSAINTETVIPTDVTSEKKITELNTTIPPTADISPAQTAEPVTPAFDYNKYFEDISGGVIKDEDGFKQVLPKITQYDALLQQNQELEARMAENPFASDYVKVLNDLVKSGASAEQLKNFQKINDVGELSELNPLDAKVAKMVLLDGYKESVARKIVEKDFPVNEEDLDEDEKEIIEDKLRVSSKADIEALKQYKADMSRTNVPSQEEITLHQQTVIQNYANQVKSVIPQIAKDFHGLGDINFVSPLDKSETAMNFAFDDGFKAEMTSKLVEYFTDGLTPISEETINNAYHYLKTIYLGNNYERMMQSYGEHIEAKTWEKAVNKYENRSGLPTGTTAAPLIKNQDTERNNFLKSVASGR